MNRFIAKTIMVVALALPVPVLAANVAIVGGTNGPDCNSGGYFKPSAVTVNAGDTVTVSVPANDPYSGGLQIHGFPGGNFTVAPGAEHTTDALSSNVKFYGTWPDANCTKGSGTVTVAPAGAAATPAATNSPQPLAAAASASPSPSASPAAKTAASNTGALVGGGIVVLVLAGLAWWLIARRRAI